MTRIFRSDKKQKNARPFALRARSRTGVRLRIRRALRSPPIVAVDKSRGDVHTLTVSEKSGLFRIARAGLHRFEEPCISGEGGSGTLFFSGCDMRCVFCQNYALSRHGSGLNVNGDDLVALMLYLEREGAENINLVTPTPWAKRLILVLEEFKKHSKLPIVWNSNGCDAVETLRALEGLVDVWLPDFKYSDDALGHSYGAVEDCLSRSVAALSEMRRQRPKDVFDERGIMREGVIVRHLVLPAAEENTRGVLRAIADVDDSLFVSLMGQYFPTPAVAEHPVLSRRITEEEYERAADAFFEAGLTNGFSQELSSAVEDYVPDFDIDSLDALVRSLRR